MVGALPACRHTGFSATRGGIVVHNRPVEAAQDCFRIITYFQELLLLRLVQIVVQHPCRLPLYPNSVFLGVHDATSVARKSFLQIEKEPSGYRGHLPVGQESKATGSCFSRAAQGLGCDVPKQTRPVFPDFHDRIIHKAARRGLD
jgi:hypothetical protein